MNILLRPEVQSFIDEQVKSGRFASTAEVLEAGIARLMLDPDSMDVDADESSEIRKSLEQMRRGQVIDWREHSAKLRKKYLGQ